MKKYHSQFIVIIILMMGLTTPVFNVFAGACGHDSEVGLLRKIHGPANLRDHPNGEIVGQLAMGTEVKMLNYQEVKKDGKVQHWYLVEYTESSTPKSAWTIEQNIICD